METPLVSIILNVNTVNSKYERGIFQAPREKHKPSVISSKENQKQCIKLNVRKYQNTNSDNALEIHLHGFVSQMMAH